MALNLIVLAITLLLASFLLVWVCCPWLRPWMEAPKYRIFEWDQRFPVASRPAPDPLDKPSAASGGEGR